LYHKSLFWNGNGRGIQARLAIQIPGYAPFFKNDPLHCLKRIMQHRARLKKSYHCDSTVMMSSHLAQIHNFTLRLRDIYNEKDIANFSKSVQFIAGIHVG